jgi:hypothetical protein
MDDCNISRHCCDFDPLDLDQSHSSLRSRSCHGDDDSCNSGYGNNKHNSNSLSLIDVIVPIEKEGDDDNSHAHHEKSAVATPVVKQPTITIKDDSQATMEMSHSVTNDDDFENDEMWRRSRAGLGLKEEMKKNAKTMVPQQQCSNTIHQGTSCSAVLPKIPSNREVTDIEMDQYLEPSNPRLQTVQEKELPSQTMEAHRSTDPNTLLQRRSKLRSSMKLASTKVRGAVAAIDKKRVHFGKIEIYEHLIALGIGAIPSNSGPSLTLQSEAQAYFEVSIDEYEEYRPSAPRRGSRLLRSKIQRVQV